MAPPLAANLHRLSIEIAALAQNGLAYGTDHYEIDRYNRLRAISAELLGLIADGTPAEIESGLALERGHATPKVDVRGALFEGDRVLLVREARDGRWTLPGGWADALDRPAGAAEREFAEEAGLAVRAVKLAAVHDGSVHNGHSPVGPWHIYKLFFVMERRDAGAPTAGLDGETDDVGFFGLDDLPTLSTPRTTAEQLRRLLAHQRDRGLPTDFD